MQCALTAGVISAAFSWQSVSESPWSTTSLWYGSLVLDLTAICLATQQSVALNRLSCYRDGPARIRALLGKRKKHLGAAGREEESANICSPRLGQLYVWQTAIMLLNFSILLFTVGLTIFVFDQLGRRERSTGAWTEGNVKVSGN